MEVGDAALDSRRGRCSHHTVFLIHYLEFANVLTDREAIKSKILHVPQTCETPLFIDILILRCRPL